MEIKDMFKSGEWIMADDEFALVECVVPIYYEQYDANKNEDEQVGDYKHTLISYHTFCTSTGKICSSAVQIKILDFCSWIRRLTLEESALLEKILERKAEAYDKWGSKCKEAVEYTILYADVESGKSKGALTKLRKAIKSLPEKFTFEMLLSVIKTIPEITSISTDDITDEYISFKLSYKLKEQKGKELMFCKIGGFEREFPEDFSQIISFEGVFILLYQITVLYNNEHPSVELQKLIATLKETGLALYNHDFKNSPLAKDFHRKAPKVLYSPELAYSTISDFLCRNSESLGIEFYAELVKKRDEEIVRIFNKLVQADPD